MKKIFAALLALVLFCTSALALQGEGYPAYDGGALPENGLALQLASGSLLLEFDDDQDYSGISDGHLQACYFCFDAKEENYLELYLLLPEKIADGDVITPSSSFAGGYASTSISLFEVDKDNNETAWFAGQILGAGYPQGSDYSISVHSAQYTQNSVRVQGSIDAKLCRIEKNQPSGEIIEVKADFDFTLPLSGENASAPQPKDAPAAGKAPAFTLPPDYITL